MTLEDIGYRLRNFGGKECYEKFPQSRIVEFDHEFKTVRTYSDYQNKYAALKLTPKEVAAIYEMIKQMGWI